MRLGLDSVCNRCKCVCLYSFAAVVYFLSRLILAFLRDPSSRSFSEFATKREARASANSHAIIVAGMVQSGVQRWLTALSLISTAQESTTSNITAPTMMWCDDNVIRGCLKHVAGECASTPPRGECPSSTRAPYLSMHGMVESCLTASALRWRAWRDGIGG